MKEKGLAGQTRGQGARMSTEAEALRKDPLKNYAEEERIVDMD